MTTLTVSEDTLQTLAERFCAAPLPRDVCTDSCATMSDYPHLRHGTNLLTVSQAKEVFRSIFTAPLTTIDGTLQKAVDEFTQKSGIYFSADSEQSVVDAIKDYASKNSISQGVECHGLDTSARICFYEQDFYVLSNFSSFAINWGTMFPTSEHLYHYFKFDFDYDFAETDVVTKARYDVAKSIGSMIAEAPSAHAAYQIAQEFKHLRVPDWDEPDHNGVPKKVAKMLLILRAKVEQHEYVKRKLLDTGDRELVENSWRDPYWGWGPERNGKNVLGKLWMHVRNELRTDIAYDDVSYIC